MGPSRQDGTSRGCEELGWLKQIKSASRRLPIRQSDFKLFKFNYNYINAF